MRNFYKSRLSYSVAEWYNISSWDKSFDKKLSNKDSITLNIVFSFLVSFIAYTRPLGMGSGQINKNQITGGNMFPKRHAKYDSYYSILTDPKYSPNAARLKETSKNENFFKAMFNSKPAYRGLPEPFLGEWNYTSIGCS